MRIDYVIFGSIELVKYHSYDGTGIQYVFFCDPESTKALQKNNGRCSADGFMPLKGDLVKESIFVSNWRVIG